MANDEPEPFPYGVASFDPTASGVLLWTRVAGADALRWEVATDPAFTDPVGGGLTGAGEVDETGEASHVVTVSGLTAATDHFYRFRAAGDGGDAEAEGPAWSPTGRTRTLPADDRPFRIGLACCGDYSAGHFAAYRALAEADVDVVIHLGDYVYADPEGDLRQVDPDHNAVTRADYRARYAQVRQDPDLQALHQRHPMFAVIDDHDLVDNANREGSKHHDPETDGPWSVRFEAATTERLAWLPIRTEGPDGREDPGQWRSATIGTLGELVLLDTRLSGRDPQTDDGGVGLHDRERTMLGRAQMRWARERICDTTLPWSLVISSVVVNPMQIDLPGRFRVNQTFPSGYLIEEGVAINTDGWDGYPADRERLVSALRRRGAGGVILSGDVHSAWAFEGPIDDEGPVAVELTCPAVTSKPMGEMVPVLGKGLEAYMAARDNVAWADLYARGHLLVDVTATSVTGTWYFSDSEDPAAEARRGASWATELARPGRLVEVDADPEHGVEPTGEEAAPTPPSDGAPADDRPDQRDRPVPEPVPPRPDGVVAAERRTRRRRRLVATVVVTAAVLRGVDRRRRA